MPGRRYGGGRGNKKGRRRPTANNRHIDVLDDADEDVDGLDYSGDDVERKCKWDLLVKNTFISVSWLPTLAPRSSRSTPACSRELDRQGSIFTTARLELSSYSVDRRTPRGLLRSSEDDTSILDESNVSEESVGAEQSSLQTENHVAVLTRRVAELEAENQALRTKAEAAKKVALRAVQAAQTPAVAELTLARAEQQASTASWKTITIPEDSPAVVLQAPSSSNPLRHCFSAVLASRGVGNAACEAGMESRTNSGSASQENLQESEQEKSATPTAARVRPKMHFREIPLSKSAASSSGVNSCTLGGPMLNATAASRLAKNASLSEDTPCILGAFTSAFTAGAAGTKYVASKS